MPDETIVSPADASPAFWLQNPVARSMDITDRFNAPRDYPPNFKHEGVDLAALDGAGRPVNVLAAQVGVVERVMELSTGYGKFVRVAHTWGTETYKTWYAHLSMILAVPGQFVRPGDVIGVAGTTGNSTGVHLHLTVQHIGRGLMGYSVDDVIDPEPLLRAAAQPEFDLLALVDDVTARDGSVFAPGARFRKTWRVRNVGTRTWRGYSLAFGSGERMDGPQSVPLPDAAPGAVVDVSVELAAPGLEGRAIGLWQPRGQSDGPFGQVLDVTIDVRRPQPRDVLNFVADVTVPDGALMEPGQDFVKTWRVRNGGDTLWEEGYTLGHSAERRMSGPDSVSLPRLAPGEVAEVSVPLRAPTTRGRYKSVWRPRRPNGTFFDFELFADVVVTRDQAVVARLDEARFVADVTVPDGTVFKPNERFVKTWRLRNSGNTTWDERYTFAYFSGTDMGAPRSVGAPTAAPGQVVEISLRFTAPAVNGRYRTVYKLRNAAGRFFEFDMYAEIVVRA